MDINFTVVNLTKSVIAMEKLFHAQVSSNSECVFYRVAVEVALSIQTGKTESMNSPVSKIRLKEMYDDLRLNWPNIKKHLKSQKENPDSVRAHIQVQSCLLK